MNTFANYRKLTAPSQLKQLYDTVAPTWQAGIENLGYMDAYSELAERACDAAPTAENETILDAGTGSGAMSLAMTSIHDKAPDMQLLDLSPVMLEQAAARVPGTVRTVVGLIGCANLPEHRFDRVLCAHVIEHTVDPVASLEWLRDRLRPGGQIVLAISRPHWCTALLRWRFGNSAYRPEKVRQFLDAAGFKDISVHRHRRGPPSRTSCGYIAYTP